MSAAAGAPGPESRTGPSPKFVTTSPIDSPSLAAATVSASAANAADVSQTVADVVFQGRRLAPVATVIETARRARGVMRQNLALSIGYNVLMVPLAVAGFVTPWLAAAAMSSSSLLVMANSFRLRGRSA